jgi:hypothetical protein
MLESLAAFNVVTQALVATTATYLLTAVGTLPVLFFRSAPRRLMDAMMGFAAGVMVAASCWSLLVPAIDRGGLMPASIGLLLGGAFLYTADQLLPHLRGEFPNEATAEGPRVAWQRSALLMLAMTLHNFSGGPGGGRQLRWRRSGFRHRAGDRHWLAEHPRRSGDSPPASIRRHVAGTGILLGPAFCGGRAAGGGPPGRRSS